MSDCDQIDEENPECVVEIGWRFQNKNVQILDDRNGQQNQNVIKCQNVFYEEMKAAKAFVERSIQGQNNFRNLN